MKNIKLSLILLISILSLFSCSNEHLDEKIFKNNDITVKWYKISEITSVHDFIDLEHWGYSKNIMKANTEGVFDIQFKDDTIIIRTLPKLIIYDLVAIANDCQIKLDSSVTKYEYMKKFHPENAKHYIEENNRDSIPKE